MRDPVYNFKIFKKDFFILFGSLANFIDSKYGGGKKKS